MWLSARSFSLYNGSQWAYPSTWRKKVHHHGDLQEDVFMHQPPNFVDSNFYNYVCKTKKCSIWSQVSKPLRGVTNVLRYFYNNLSSCQKWPVFVHMLERILICWWHHLNYLMCCLSTRLISLVQDEFPMNDLGHFSYFLGISFSLKVPTHVAFLNVLPLVLMLTLN